MPIQCPICDAVAELRYDHCHTSGRFRDWICDRCNIGLGKFEDDPALLRLAADYLEAHA